MNSFSQVPGAYEVVAARRFFFGLRRRDPRMLAELLGETPTFENIDGPVPVQGREQLARALAGRADDVAYELVDIRASPGEAQARFLLLVEGVPGSILLEARLGFAGERIISIRVSQPLPRGVN